MLIMEQYYPFLAMFSPFLVAAGVLIYAKRNPDDAEPQTFEIVGAEESIEASCRRILKKREVYPQ